jgi:hypothetical protein
MSYIIKKTDPLVNVKLTDKGREQLSLGQLQFTKFTLSDAEMIYTNEDPTALNILRPADNQPAAHYVISSEGANAVLPIPSLVSYPMISYADAKERGFFSGSTHNDFVLGYMISGAYKVLFENLSGGTSLTVTYDSDITITATTINPSGDTPTVGDLMLIKFAGTGCTSVLTPYGIDNISTPYLWYQITSITINGNDLIIGVDRNLPNLNLSVPFTGNTGFAYFYHGGNMIEDVFDEENPSAYWSAGLLDFTDTCSNASHDVPIWNMNVVYVIDIIGLDNEIYKGFEETESDHYEGLYTYLMYAAWNAHQNKFGIIHYTNNTVSNYYGEGFYEDNLELHLPTLMWHKKQFGGAGFGDDIGYTFVCDTDLKNIGNIKYYDLIDTEETATAVGKVFPDLKIIVIENEDLITAMSLKSNRNWSLPKPILTDVEAGRCPGSSTNGIITSEEELHVTYALIDSTNGVTGVHCEDFATIGTTKPTADVLFQFPYSPEDLTYSEFPYFKRHADGVGFSADDIWIILQKTDKGEKPDPAGWYYFNADQYLGSDGCINIAIPNVDDFELYNESVIVTNQDKTNYQLSYQPLGDVIVSLNGSVLKEASNISYIYYQSGCTQCGDYILTGSQVYFGVEESHLEYGDSRTALKVGDILQFHYLRGTSVTATTVKLSIFVPDIIGATGDIYTSGGEIYIDLPTTPFGNIYVFYNGQVLSSSNYSVISGGAYSERVLFNFVPVAGSRLIILYLDGSGTYSPADDIEPIVLNDLKITLNDQTFSVLATEMYNLNDIITLPATNTTGLTFSDETIFFCNITTKIKATTYKTIINIPILPNRFITSSNPTFNENIDKVAFTELDIYDNSGNVVAVGKFSQPLQRKSNSDVQIINAIIDF